MTQSNNNLDSLTILFNEHGWAVELNPETDTLWTQFKGSEQQWDCVARIEEQTFVMWSLCPLEVPEHKFWDILEFVTRANSMQSEGCFEFDFEDGQIAFRASVDFKGTTLSEALWKRVVENCTSKMEYYLPGFSSVIDKDTSPIVALSQVEDEIDRWTDLKRLN